MIRQHIIGCGLKIKFIIRLEIVVTGDYVNEIQKLMDNVAKKYWIKNTRITRWSYQTL